MTAAPKLAAFAAALAAVFGLAAFAGANVGPDRDGKSTSTQNGGEMTAMVDERGHDAGARETAAGGHDGESGGHAREGGAHGAHGGAADPVRGLAVSSDGLTLSLEREEFDRGRPSELRFRILDAEGAAVRDFDVEHERRMHLIVVRRDGAGFQHLHPELADDGTWSVPVTLPDAGAHRVFADFSHGGEAYTLGTDVTVDGEADYRPFPEPVTSAGAGDGYEVRIDAHDVRAGAEAELTFTVERDGERVRPEPYLGARGHLVALRDGDLAFLHVHPDEDSLAFMAEFPSAGRYRLYLQFKHEGEVHTAAFTQAVGEGGAAGEGGATGEGSH